MSSAFPDPEDPANQRRDAASIGSLIADIAADASSLVRQEVELAKTELSEFLHEKKVGAITGAIGLVSLLLVIPLVFVTVIEVFDVFIPRWVAALIVTLFAVLVAGVTMLAARQKLTKTKIPERTVRSIKENAAWIKSLKNSNNE